MCVQMCASLYPYMLLGLFFGSFSSVCLFFPILFFIYYYYYLHYYLLLISILMRKGKKKCEFGWMGNWRGSGRSQRKRTVIRIYFIKKSIFNKKRSGPFVFGLIIFST